MGALSGKMGAVYKSYTGTDKSKEIANFQSSETWEAGAGATATDDSSIFRLGTKSISILDDDDTGSYNTLKQNNVSTLDLTKFDDGSTSDIGDYIVYVFYVTNVTYITEVAMIFSPDAVFDSTDYYTYTISNVTNGWNYVKVKKSLFTEVGTASWSAVQSIQVLYLSTTNANTNSASVKFQSLYLLDDSKTYDFALIDNTAYTLECMTLIYNWTVDAQTDVADVTSFLCEGVQFKEFIPLLNSFTVSSEAFWGNGDFLNNLTSNFILSLYIDTLNGYRYDGLGKLTSDNISNDVADVVNETIEFQGDGDLKYVDVQIIDS
jgi:hypothetical protein